MEACLTHPDASDLFPFDSIRGGQAQFLEDARMCMTNKTHLLAHAPTGIGKTAVSLAASMETVMQHGGLALFLTARHSQHTIAIETLRNIDKKEKIRAVDLIAREEMCLARRAGGGVPCREGKDCLFAHGPAEKAAAMLLDHPLPFQESMRMCLKMSVCPYRAASSALSRCDVAICDYNQVFSAEGTTLLEKCGRAASEALIVVDEGHNLPSRIMENGSGHLSLLDIESALLSSRLRRFHEDLEVLKTIFMEVTSRVKPEAKLREEDIDMPLKVKCGVDSGGLAEEMNEALKDSEVGHKNLVEFLARWNRFGSESIRYLDKRKRTMVCRLMDPSVISKPIFDAVRCGLVMSGTLHPPEMFADVLGIERRLCRRYSSPFPPENRLIAVTKGVSSRYRLRSQAMYQAAAQQLGSLCSLIPGNIAAFFPSYDFLSQVEDQLKIIPLEKVVRAERRDYGRNEKDAIMASLRLERNTLLLATISGSFSEGVDFKDNILSSVVVVGFPISPPTPEAEAIEQALSQRFGKRRAELYSHIYPAVSKVLQAAGRPIRSERDRAAIILMDDRYLIPMVRSSFPLDFPIERPADIGAALRDFFGKEGSIGIESKVSSENDNAVNQPKGTLLGVQVYK